MSLTLLLRGIALAKDPKTVVLLRNSCSSFIIKKHYATKKTLFERVKPSCIIGTIGDHGHGKTTLTSAITKVLSETLPVQFLSIEDIYKHPEEKAKQMTINSYVGSLQTENRYYTHIDLPGSQKYFKNMIRDCAVLDFAIFVVSPLDGLTTLGKENLRIAKQLGVKNVVIFLNKVDESASDLVEITESEIRDTLKEFGFDSENTPFIAGSAQAALNNEDSDGIGKTAILNLIKAIDGLPIPKRSNDVPCLLNILNAFSVPGIGTVIRGKLEKGTLKIGDKLVVQGHGFRKEDTVHGLEIFRIPTEEGIAGDFISVQVKGLKRDDISKGMIAHTQDFYKETDNFEGEITLPPGIEFDPEEHRRCKFYTRSTDSECIVTPIEENNTNTTRMKFVLRKRTILEDDQPFLLEYNPNLRAVGHVSKSLPMFSDEMRLEQFVTKKKK